MIRSMVGCLAALAITNVARSIINGRRERVLVQANLRVLAQDLRYAAEAMSDWSEHRERKGEK